MAAKRTRFFYAPFWKRAWPKIFVLTEDGRFYCEYLNYMRPSSVELKFDFDTFTPKDYQWNGYQPIEEVEEENAKSRVLVHQENWVERYLSSLQCNGAKDCLENTSN